jgi:fermentation-respiration switch protein FrsA (DUF1100 family)
MRAKAILQNRVKMGMSDLRSVRNGKSRLKVGCALLIIVLFFFAGIPIYAEASGGETSDPWLVSGTWEGSLSVGSASLRLVYSIVISDEGKLTATMDSPDQGVRGIPVAAVSFEGDGLVLTVAAVGGSFEGRLDAAAASIEGFWKQGGGSFPLTLRLKEGSRGEKPETAQKDAGRIASEDNTSLQEASPEAKESEAAPRQEDSALWTRTQEPKPPFPYLSKDLSVAGGDGTILAGTLTLPEGQGPFPAALLVTGSGAQDRNETIFGHKPFWVIADYLARRGIAALRLDDRGVGESQGDFAAATTLDFAADAQAALEYLKTYPGIDAGRLGIIGHSEGGLIAPIVASKMPELDFIVLLAGPGVSGEELLYEQQAAIAEAYGIGPEAIQSANRVNRALYEVAKRPDRPEELRDELIAVYLSFLPASTDEASKAKAKQDAAFVAEQLLSPWLRTFLVLDPRPYLRDLTLPVLAMNGSKDLQVPSGENLEAIRQALVDAGNTRFSIAELPGLNHLFQEAKTGLPDEYSQIQESFSEKALQKMGDWLAEVLGL